MVVHSDGCRRRRRSTQKQVGSSRLTATNKKTGNPFGLGSNELAKISIAERAGTATVVTLVDKLVCTKMSMEQVNLSRDGVVYNI